MPVIQALPRMAGTIATRSPTRVTSTMRPSKVDPIAEACVMPSPTAISPRARRTAMRAERPVPVAERSSRPGATTTAFFVTSPTPLPRRCDLHDAYACDGRVLRMHAGKLLPGGSANRLSGEREIACLVRLDLEAERLCVCDRVPHAAVGDVHRRAFRALRPRAARRADRRSSGTFVNSTRLAAAVATRRARPRRRRPALRAAGSSPARASRRSPSRAGPSRCRSCSIPTSPDTRSAP